VNYLLLIQSKRNAWESVLLLNYGITDYNFSFETINPVKCNTRHVSRIVCAPFVYVNFGFSFSAANESSNFALSKFRLLRGDASGRDQAALRYGSKMACRAGIGSLTETWKGSQARRISVRSSHGCIARAPYLPGAFANTLERIGANTLRSNSRSATQYVTFARCKCVVPHAISWSNGPRCRRLANTNA